jgi:hypothetical protein
MLLAQLCPSPTTSLPILTRGVVPFILASGPPTVDHSVCPPSNGR